MTAGTTYLIHLDAPLGDPDRPCMSATHYLGWTAHDDVDERVAQHRAGLGARLLASAVARGITFAVVRVWPNTDRHHERRLKKSGHFADRLCPVCREVAA